MQQVYGMKVIVLTRGDLPDKSGLFFRTDNPFSDGRLNRQESAETIVPARLMNKLGRAERKDVFKLCTTCEQSEESRQSRSTKGLPS